MDKRTAMRLWRQVNRNDFGDVLPTTRQIHAFAQRVAEVAEDAERKRLLSMLRLMHGCDALGVRGDGEHCALLRQAILGTSEPPNANITGLRRTEER